MERNDAITTLEVLRANCSKHSRDYQALEYAINSLKTDETYQLMYEGEEIYTKADLVAMLTELQLEIEELEKPRCHNASHADGCVSKWKVEGVIQQKINSLKENENGNK